MRSVHRAELLAMTRFGNADAAELDSDDDYEMTQADFEELRQLTKQQGGRPAATPEERAAKRAKVQQERREALASEPLVVPPKMDDLEGRNWSTHLTAWSKDNADAAHTKLATRRRVESLMAQINESTDHDVAVRTSGPKHVLTGINPSKTDTRVVQVCSDVSCPYRTAFTTELPKKKDGTVQKDGQWHLIDFVEHAETCRVSSKARPRKCHYGKEDFAAIILDSKPNDVFSVEPKTAKALIEPYIWEDADDDMAHRAIICSIEELYGKEDEHFRKLPYLADELEKLDYDVDLYTTNAAGMNKIIKMCAESEHKRQYKHLPPAERPKFEWTDEYRKKIKAPKAKEGETYLVGWSINVIPAVKDMLESGLVSKIRASDACFGKGRGQGNFFLTWTKDANHHLLLLSASWSAFDETYESWTRHLKPTLAGYGDESSPIFDKNLTTSHPLTSR